MILLVLLLFFSFLTNIVLGYLLVRASRRLLQFDDLVELLVHDMEVNIRYFDKLVSTPVLSNVQEIQDANRNMNIMSRRLDEYLSQMEELVNKKLRRNTQPRPPLTE